MQLSIVTMVYKSERYLDTFIRESLEAVNGLGIEHFEMIFVLDGITDNSLAFLLSQKAAIPQIQVIELSRNFGHHYAASAGLHNATGDYIFIIDCDLEVSPKVLVDFKKEIDLGKADVVYGVQKTRKGGVAEKVLGGLFWKGFNMLSDIKMPANIVTERLMTRRYVDALLSLGDKNLFLGGMMYWVGFEQKGIEIGKKQRQGKSTYTLRKRFNLLVEAITSFSEKPLKLIFRLGLWVTLISVAVIAGILIKKIINPASVLLGYTSIVIAIMFSLGVLTTSIGIVGIYLSRVFRQTQDRPNYIIRKKY